MSGLPAQRRGAGRARTRDGRGRPRLRSVLPRGRSRRRSIPSGSSGCPASTPHLALQTVQLEPGDPLLSYRLSESIRALYALGLFDRVEAVARVDRRPARDAGLPRDRARPDHPRQLPGPALHEHRGPGGPRRPETGQLSSPAALFRASQEIEKAYRDEGYARARVTPEISPDSSGLGVAVTLRIDEGPRVKVRAVNFTGATAFSPGAELRGAIQLRPAGLPAQGTLHQREARGRRPEL